MKAEIMITPFRTSQGQYQSRQRFAFTLIELLTNTPIRSMSATSSRSNRGFLGRYSSARQKSPDRRTPGSRSG
jgi:hypothetical protein